MEYQSIHLTTYSGKILMPHIMLSEMRFIKRKLGRSSRNNETLKSLIRLLKWTEKFYSVNLIEIQEKLSHYQGKVAVLCRRNDINAVLD